MDKLILLSKKEWRKRVNKLNIYDDIKEHVINLFEFNNDNFYFHKIQNSKVKDAFYNIKTYKNIYIVFDIEFQSVILNKEMKNTNKYKYDFTTRDDPIASFPREFGMMLFVRDRTNNIFYLGSIFRNFVPLFHVGFELDDMRYMLAKYSTVSEDTLEKMEKNDEVFTLAEEIEQLYKGDYKSFKKSPIYQLEKKTRRERVEEFIDELEDIQSPEYDYIDSIVKKIKRNLRNTHANIVRKYLDKNIQKLFDNQLDIYYDDPLVVKRQLNHSEEKDFIKTLINVSSNSCFVIKGLRDLDALNNIAKHRNNKETFDFNHLYDIEIFNGFSKKKYGNAQLERTYYGLIKSNHYLKNKEDMELIKQNIGHGAHNPLVDSYYTLVVAIVINIGLNDVFPERTAFFNKQKGGDIGGKRTKYKTKYKLAKEKYNLLKDEFIKSFV